MQVKDLNRKTVYFIIMGLDDLINIEKTIKNIGIYMPIFIYGYLVYISYNTFFLSFLIISFVLSALYIALKETLIAEIGKDKGNKLAKKMSKWNAKKTLARLSIFYITWINLIISLIVLILEIKKDFNFVLLILLLFGSSTVLYQMFVLYMNKNKIKAFNKQIKKG